MRRAVWLVALLGACGRVGFDARRDTVDAPPALDAPICHTGAFATPQQLASIATVSQESDPWISPDELTLYMTSNRSGGMQRAVWRTTRASRGDAFGPPSLVGELDSAVDDNDPTLTVDELTIYFSSNRGGTLDLYVATRSDKLSAFGGVAPLVIGGDAAQKSAPELTRDELALYYSSGLAEVAYAARTVPSGPFTFVREVDEVNVPATDGNPTLTADGLELFFDTYASGQAAIFRASRTSVMDLFSPPVEVTELTAVAGGLAAGTPAISVDGKTLYYHIDVGGQLDLYTATRSCD